LTDDKKAFGSYQACIMARHEMLAGEPRLRPALEELSGKFTNDIMRKLDAEVDVKHRQVAAVAAEFLTRAGLK
jgi:glycine betaine/choline ABC-type transport system substrate-binding protein